MLMLLGIAGGSLPEFCSVVGLAQVHRCGWLLLLALAAFWLWAFLRGPLLFLLILLASAIFVVVTFVVGIVDVVVCCCCCCCCYSCRLCGSLWIVSKLLPARF